MAERKRLNLEVREEVKGVDAVITKIIKDRDSWKEFFKNPAGVLTKMGFGKPISEEGQWKYNKIFYALLTDKELIHMLYTADGGLRLNAKQVDAWFSNLRQGKVEFDPESDVDIVNQLVDQPEMLRGILQRAFKRINSEGVLSKQYDDADIEKAIDGLVADAKGDPSLKEMARKLPWNKDLEEDIGHIMAVVPPAVAVPVVAEAVACGTIACVVVPMAESGTATDSLKKLQGDALEGDKDSVKGVVLLGSLIEFIGELANHVNDFERILRD